MKAEDARLSDILGTTNRYVIPLFQRFYSWGKADWEKLWDDVAELHEEDAAEKSHFMGSLVFMGGGATPKKHGPFQVIDGQQRLLTASILLCAVRDAARQGGHDELADEIRDTYLVSPYKKGVERFRVYPRQRDRDQYAAVVEAQPAEGNVAAARHYFLGRMVEDGFVGEERLRALFLSIVERLDFVNVVLDGESPYRIFKSLNSTGVDLSEADLIRNFVFMHVPLDEQDEFDKAEWEPLEAYFQTEKGLDTGALSNFLRDTLMTRGQYVKPSTAFETFEARHAKGFEPAALAANLRAQAARYAVIRGKAPHSDAGVARGVRHLRRLMVTTTYALELRLAEEHAEGRLSVEGLQECYRLLASFVMRRFMCGWTSRTYSKWFVSACGAIKDEPTEDLRAFLKDKGFPDDERFSAGIQAYNLYDSLYGRWTLEVLEESLEHKEKVDVSGSEFQVEHVMPQTLTDAWREELGPEHARVHATWLHRLGNLTLTAYNPVLGNRPFEEKRGMFTGSHVLLTKEVAAHESWGEEEMQARGERLAQRALAIWGGLGQ